MYTLGWPACSFVSFEPKRKESRNQGRMKMQTHPSIHPHAHPHARPNAKGGARHHPSPHERNNQKKKKRVCIPCCCCCFVSYLSQPGRNNLSTPPRRCERWPAITQSTSLSLFCPANIITGVFLVQLVGSLRCWPVSLYRQTLCHLAALLRDVMAGRINSSCDTALTGITRATSRHKCPKNKL